MSRTFISLDSAGRTLAGRIEEASLNAWPALHTALYDGWLLRFSQGYTRRANSVTPLYAGTLDLTAKISACEALYAHHALPPIFRLTAFGAPDGLDARLTTVGYTRDAPTGVLHLDLTDRRIHPALIANLRDDSPADWLALFHRFSARPAATAAAHRAIIERIPTPHLRATMQRGGQAVAVGLAVLEGDLIGLFDLVVDPYQRSQGIGTQLVASLLKWGLDHGARRAYLAVMDDNTPARHIYEDKFGFRQLYTYWYRVKPSALRVNARAQSTASPDSGASPLAASGGSSPAS